MNKTDIAWKALCLEASFLMGQESASLLEAFYRDCRLRNLSDKTLDGYADRLAFLVQKFQGKPITQITQSDVKEYLSGIIADLSPATVNGRIRVFRLFFRWLEEQGIIKDEPTKGIKLLKQDLELKATLSISQLNLLFSAFDRKTYEGNRNLVMFTTMFDSMIRVGELVRIKMGDLHLEERHIMILRSKGRRYRGVPLSTETARMINIFLARWRRSIPGEWVFPDVEGKKLREDSTYHILQKAGKRVGLKTYPHMLRRTAATLYAQEGPMGTLQGILGHTDPRTTMAYVQYQPDSAAALHEQYSPVNRLKK